MAVIISDSGFVSLGLLIFTQISGLHSITTAYTIMGIAGIMFTMMIAAFAVKGKHRSDSH